MDTKGDNVVRPKKDEREVKSYSLRVRMTDDELKKIRDLAKKNNLSVSDYVRRCSLGDKTE